MIANMTIMNPEEMPDKQNAWQSVLEKVAQLKDKIGGEMDEGIIETVAAFWLHKIPTSGSCEGHIDWGSDGPWIRVESPDRPKERFHHEIEIKEKIAARFGVTLEAIDDYENREASEVFWSEAVASGETEAFQKFRERNARLEEKVSALLNEFYTNHETSDDVLLKIQRAGPGGMFYVYSGEFDKDSVDATKLSEEEKADLLNTLKSRQKEMRAFTEFLKNKPSE